MKPEVLEPNSCVAEPEPQISVRVNLKVVPFGHLQTTEVYAYPAGRGQGELMPLHVYKYVFPSETFTVPSLNY